MPKKLFVVFSFFFLTTCTAQVVDTTNKSTHNFSPSLAIGPHFILLDATNILFGPNILINTLLHHHFLISADLHAAISSQFLSGSDYFVHDIASISLLPGCRVYSSPRSAFQFQAGISYGTLLYHGQKYGYTHEKEKIKFIGLPLKICYQLYHKVVGLETYLSANLHSHFETAVGFNFLLGRLN